MSFGLEHKVVLITGAASGIGKAAAIAFAENGAKVVVSDINEKQGLSTVNEILSAGGEAIFVKCNVANADDVRSMIETTMLTYESLDVAINNAGIAGSAARTTDVDHKDFTKVMDINCTGVFYCMQAELKEMVK